MKFKHLLNLQLFADDPGEPGDGGKGNEPGAEDKPKYSDKDLDNIISKKFAKWQEKQQKAVDEAKKLAEMNATQKAEYERDQLQKELDGYTGTPSAIGDVPPGKNAVTGEIEFLCVDPFKYSVIEYEAEANLDESSVLIDYNGTYKSYLVLEADFFDESEVSADGESAVALTGAGDCGYVAFFTEDEKIIQLGDPDEVDGVTAYAKAQTLVNQPFNTATAWGTRAKSLWAMNAGHVMAAKAKRLGVEIRMNTEVTPELIGEIKPHTVMNAIGATPLIPQIPGADLPFVVNSHDVLNGKAAPSGTVVVIGGGMVGMEVAEYLAEKGCKVTDLEMLKEFCMDMGIARKTCVTESVYAAGITPVTEVMVRDAGRR